MITQEQVKKLFSYDNGKLIRKVALCNKVKIGDVAGGISSNGYIQSRVFGKLYLNHRIIFIYHYGYLPEFLDHIDGNKLNNKIENIRECTKSENNQNVGLRKDNSSGVKGVCWHKSNKKWQVRVSVDGKEKTFGFFSNIIDAKIAIEKIRAIHHGEFANHGR